jgi:hypothetical protein
MNATIDVPKDRDAVHARRALDDAEEALEAFLSNRKAIALLGQERWNAELEEYVVQRDMARMELNMIEKPDMSHLLSVPELWEEWTIESRREFLSKILKSVIVEPANRQRVPVAERVTIEVNPVWPRGSYSFSLSELPETWEILIEGEPLGR